MKYSFLFLTLIAVKSKKIPYSNDFLPTEKINDKEKFFKLFFIKQHGFNGFKILDKQNFLGGGSCLLFLTLISNANCQGSDINQNNFRPGVLSYEQNQTTNIFLIVTFVAHIISLFMSAYIVFDKFCTYRKNTAKKQDAEIKETHALESGEESKEEGETGEKKKQITIEENDEDAENKYIKDTLNRVAFDGNEKILIKLWVFNGIVLIFDLFTTLMLLKKI